MKSDEITLTFPSGTGSFNERVQKIASLAAAFTSVKFALHLAAAVAAHPEPHVKEGVLGSAYFDARLFTVPSVEEALNCLIWRCRGDAVRNSVNGFARTMFSQKELDGKSSARVLEMMEAKGVCFKEVVPSWAVEGTIVKKELVEGEGMNKVSGEMEKVMRTRTKAVDRGMMDFSAANLRLVTEKYWEV